MNLPHTIAIDGPAASGKSTLAKRMAEALDYLFFDTGVMYRAITCAALRAGLSMDEEDQITALSERAQIDVQSASADDGRDNDILLDGVDITWDIRSPEVDANVSVVSAYPGVRAALTAQQRRIGQRGRVVMVGRDIGTVVLPEADLKLYLDASVEERARRRYDERLNRGDEIMLEVVLADMRMRDEIDSTRAVAPLRPADDAVILDSDNMNIDEVLAYALGLARGEG
ncbi:MAG: (d)CMP kinase [Chloroflexi bacterium]|jgi:CMP/dCMP kinase|nr:(d)CMP kinase [Chloroflexota bacterium]